MTLVNLLSRRQAVKLADINVGAVGELVQIPADTRVRGIRVNTLDRLQKQAELQLKSRETERIETEYLEPIENRGFARLPLPSVNDVFFDIEGDPYWDKQGLEYLLGSSYYDNGSLIYKPLWAHSREEERLVFEKWVDWVIARFAADPGMHVFHYAPYEKTALQTLMLRYGTRDDEIDRLHDRDDRRGEGFTTFVSAYWCATRQPNASQDRR